MFGMMWEERPAGKATGMSGEQQAVQPTGADFVLEGTGWESLSYSASSVEPLNFFFFWNVEVLIFFF